MNYYDFDEYLALFPSNEGRTMTATGGSLHPLQFEFEIPSSPNGGDDDSNWDLLNNDGFESFDDQAMVASYFPEIMFNDDQDHEMRPEPLSPPANNAPARFPRRRCRQVNDNE